MNFLKASMSTHRYHLFTVLLLGNIFFYFISQLTGIQRTYIVSYESLFFPVLAFFTPLLIVGVVLVNFIEFFNLLLNLTQFEPLSFISHLSDVSALGWSGPIGLGFVFFILFSLSLIQIKLFSNYSQKNRKQNLLITSALSFVLVISLDFSFGNIQSIKDSSSTFNPGSFISRGLLSRVKINLKTYGKTNFSLIQKNKYASSRLTEYLKENPDQNVLIVLLESFGQYENQNSIEVLFKPMEPFQKLVSGEVEFNGTTVNGEFRELCGVKLTTLNPSAPPKPCLLMDQIQSLDFETYAFHGFQSNFYSRSIWYPKIGIDHIFFKNEILDYFLQKNKKIELAEFPFPGVKDNDVLEVMSQVDQSISQTQKSLFYFLSLDSHIPVPTSKVAKVRFNCPENTPENVCNLMKAHFNQIDGVANFLAKSEKSWIILFFGDHGPPFIGVNLKKYFRDNYVPFKMFLSKKDGRS